MALFRAYLYGVMYLVYVAMQRTKEALLTQMYSLSTFALVFEDEYDMSLTMASLDYLSLGVGFVIGLQICAPINDRVRSASPALSITITDSL